MTNAEIAGLLAEMAVLLEIQGGEPFRVRAYQRAAGAVAGHGRPLAKLSARELLEVPGVGKSIAAHIAACGKSGCFPELLALRKKFPAGLRELLRLPGLGPKRARFLYDEAGIGSPEQLKKALDEGRVKGLPGFGAKAAENLARGLAFASEPERLLLADAKRLVEPILAALRSWPRVKAAEAAGSLRRGRETVGDLDVLVASSDGAGVVTRFLKSGFASRVLAKGPTKASVLLPGGVQCDLRVVPPASFGAALLYFTGSKAHNVKLRGWALRRKLTLNEYGLFKLSDKKLHKPLAGRTEEEVYAALKLPFIEPELREDRGELEAAQGGRLPRLVRLEDVKGDFHNHTSHTDGRQSMEEMARAAAARGWEWAAIGDHSQSLTVTNGLDPARLRASFAELERVRRKVPGIALMRAMEVDVLADGSLDYEDELLDEIDVVVASVHSRFKQSEPEMTRRLVAAASNRKVDILGHLSGRLLNRRPAYAFDADAVLEAAAGAGTAVEINGQPDRQDVDDARAMRARELGAPLALDSDAHSAREFDFLANAVNVARRAWLEPRHVLNCLSYPELREWLDGR